MGEIGGKYEMSQMDRGKVGIKIGGKTKCQRWIGERLGSR